MRSAGAVIVALAVARRRRSRRGCGAGRALAGVHAGRGPFVGSRAEAGTHGLPGTGGRSGWQRIRRNSAGGRNGSSTRPSARSGGPSSRHGASIRGARRDHRAPAPSTADTRTSTAHRITPCGWAGLRRAKALRCASRTAATARIHLRRRRRCRATSTSYLNGKPTGSDLALEFERRETALARRADSRDVRPCGALPSAVGRGVDVLAARRPRGGWRARAARRRGTRRGS